MTTDAILVLNAGSSSLKFSVYEIDASGEPAPLSRGQIEGLGTRPRFVLNRILPPPASTFAGWSDRFSATTNRSPRR